MFDLIVVGGGPAGYLAAERAGHAGMDVLLIEKRALGGVCLNEGCIPSKTLLYSAKIFDYANHGEKYGVTTTGASIDQKAVIARKNKVVRNLVAGIKSQMKANHVTIKEGLGEIVGRSDGIVQIKVGEEVFEGRNLLLATGSEAIVPPIPGVKEGLEAGYVLTNREILDLETIPKDLVVVGGGVIGLEMAGYFNSVGSGVTVIEMLDKIGGPTDREISEILRGNYEKKGIAFKLSCKVTGVKEGTVEYEENGETKSVIADKVLMSIGRRPVTTGFGLENIGVLVERGHIVTDDKGCTNVPNVYAAGDVNGVWMLAHAAYRESEVIINNLRGRRDNMRYNAVPSVIYTNPEVGSVGETEESCKEKGISYVKSVVSMNYSGRYMAENERGDGVCKILVDPDHDRVIGCHIIGSYASEIIIAAGMLIETEMTIDDIKEFVFPHPTVCEIIREAIFALK
ncbi:MAG: dihydrolipoyl dehydrogenase [Eubacteriales bacterium]|nr:dihydrolipoyl dehydrogenase [Eubacteriales bacterium]MDD4326596.1 dihydrolipoyl dehydrogenase [Eubacteriales bacterium]MDD4716526.1 dihydrolipoyl dehydrogenase [Eubacteriales bacterium]